MDWGLSLPSNVTSSLKGKGVLYSFGKSLDCLSHIIAITCSNSTKTAISISIPSDRLANVAEEDEPEIMFSFGLNIEPEIVCCLDMPKNKNRHSMRNSALTLNDEYWISIRVNRADYYIGLFCTQFFH